MTAYAVSEFCYKLTVDPALRARAQGDLPAALAEFALSPDERLSIAEGDVGRLFEQGVHPLLLVRLFVHSIAGLSEPDYSTRMRRWANSRTPC